MFRSISTYCQVPRDWDASSPAPAGRGAAAGVYHTPEGSPPGGLSGPGAWVLHRVCANIFVPAQADAFRRRNGQVSASRFFLWVCLADLVAVLWHAGQLVLSGEQAGGLRGCRWLCGPAGLGTRNCTGECADGPAGGCLCGCIWLCCLGMPCHQELDQGMRRWASWWLALQQPAGGRSQMADGEGREGRWWPVGGLARTKPAALRATRLLPCVVTLGLASNTPRRRPLNI